MWNLLTSNSTAEAFSVTAWGLLFRARHNKQASKQTNKQSNIKMLLRSSHSSSLDPLSWHRSSKDHLCGSVICFQCCFRKSCQSSLGEFFGSDAASEPRRAIPWSLSSIMPYGGSHSASRESFPAWQQAAVTYTEPKVLEASPQPVRWSYEWLGGGKGEMQQP